MLTSIGQVMIYASKSTITAARGDRCVYICTRRNRYGYPEITLGTATYHGQASDGSGPLLSSCGADLTLQVVLGGWNVAPQWEVFGDHHSIGLGRLWVEISGLSRK